MMQLARNNINPEHPCARFMTGNLETLKEVPKEKGIYFFGNLETLKEVEREVRAFVDFWGEKILRVEDSLCGKNIITRKRHHFEFKNPQFSSNSKIPHSSISHAS